MVPADARARHRDDEAGMRPVTADANRARILRAAEDLFAARGIEAVSLREINRMAGQRNASAVQYHFGDRAGLVKAVLARHQRDTEPRRHALLDGYEARGVPDRRALAAALVLPVAAKLGDPDGGRAYVRIACEFYSRARSMADVTMERDREPSMMRWHRLLDELDGAVGRDDPLAMRSRFAAVRLALNELAWAARGDEHDDARHRLVVGHLVDLVTAVLAADASEETRRHAVSR